MLALCVVAWRDAASRESERVNEVVRDADGNDSVGYREGNRMSEQIYAHVTVGVLPLQSG
jgi:hypothetical protein